MASLYEQYGIVPPLPDLRAAAAQEYRELRARTHYVRKAAVGSLILMRRARRTAFMMAVLVPVLAGMPVLAIFPNSAIGGWSWVGSVAVDMVIMCIAFAREM